MALYNVARSKHAALGIAIEDQVSFTGEIARAQVAIINRSGASPIYFTTNGTVPAVAGDNTDVVPAVAGREVVVAYIPGQSIRLISAAATDYSVVLRV